MEPKGTPTLPLLLAAQQDEVVRAALAGGPVDGALVRVAATDALARSREAALDYAKLRVQGGRRIVEQVGVLGAGAVALQVHGHRQRSDVRGVGLHVHRQRGLRAAHRLRAQAQAVHQEQDALHRGGADSGERLRRQMSFP